MLEMLTLGKFNFGTRLKSVTFLAMKIGNLELVLKYSMIGVQSRYYVLDIYVI